MKSVSAFWQQLYNESQEANLHNAQVEHMQMNHRLALPASIDTRLAKWLPSPAEGVKRLVLEREGGEKTIRATSIVAYSPNSQFASHGHPKGEEFFVLVGTFSDEHGDYPAGTYVRNPPGSSHTPLSREGCLIWVKLQQFEDQDTCNVVIDVSRKKADIANDFFSTKVLFSDYESVEMVFAKRDCTLPIEWLTNGIEILTLSGKLTMGNTQYQQGHWLRLPAASAQSIFVDENSQLLIKYGHLRKE